MAVIGSIRKRSGLLIIIVGVALAAFVLGDFVKRSPQRTTNVGTVNGEDISYLDFEKKVEEQIELMLRQSQKENLSSKEMFQARQNAWSIISSEIILNEEYNKLGLVVSTDELDDMVRGPNPHAYVQQFFRDPNTGQFNPNFSTDFLQNWERVNPEDQKNWLMVEKAIVNDRLISKYNNLISKAYYTPKALAEYKYKNTNTQAKFRFISVPFKSIPDTAVMLTDDDFESYYEEHKNEYDQEESRDVDYIVFNVLPSDKDRAGIQQKANQVYNEFIKTELKEVPYFVNRYTDGNFYDSSWRKKGSLPIQIDSVMFNSAVGAFSNMYIENESYHMARLIDKQFRPDSMRASHILISFQGAVRAQQEVKRTKEEAEILADSIYGIIKGDPGRFLEMSATFSDDPTAKKNEGDLDWFADGAMIGPFNDACLNGQVGDIVMIETVFGYHILTITGKLPLEEKVRIAQIQLLIEPSKETYDRIFTQASQFAANNNNLEKFDKSVIDLNLSLREAHFLSRMSDNIPGIEFPRVIVQWAFFEETEIGEVKMFDEQQDIIVVAVLREIREEGIADLNQLREVIKPLIITQKKADQIITKINEIIASSGSINQLANNLKVPVDTLDILISSVNLPRFGPEPEFMGTILTLQAGKMSEPIKGRSGVFVIHVDEFVEPQAIEDFSMIKIGIVNMFTQKVSNMVYKSLEESADIEDNRALFY
ncbi:SurA N-terminal domain-containing protein [Bacteroidota bacterium]